MLTAIYAVSNNPLTKYESVRTGIQQGLVAGVGALTVNSCVRITTSFIPVDQIRALAKASTAEQFVQGAVPVAVMSAVHCVAEKSFTGKTFERDVFGVPLKAICVTTVETSAGVASMVVVSRWNRLPIGVGAFLTVLGMMTCLFVNALYQAAISFYQREKEKIKSEVLESLPIKNSTESESTVLTKSTGDEPPAPPADAVVETPQATLQQLIEQQEELQKALKQQEKTLEVALRQQQEEYKALIQKISTNDAATATYAASLRDRIAQYEASLNEQAKTHAKTVEELIAKVEVFKMTANQAAIEVIGIKGRLQDTQRAVEEVDAEGSTLGGVFAGILEAFSPKAGEALKD